MAVHKSSVITRHILSTSTICSLLNGPSVIIWEPAFTRMFSCNVCLKGPHSTRIVDAGPSFRMLQLWRLWRHEYDVIVMWRDNTIFWWKSIWLWWNFESWSRLLPPILNNTFLAITAQQLAKMLCEDAECTYWRSTVIELKFQNFKMVDGQILLNLLYSHISVKKSSNFDKCCTLK